MIEGYDYRQATIQIGDLSPRTSDPWGPACNGFESSGCSNHLSSYNGRSPRQTPLLLCLFYFCPTHFEVTWPPSTAASSGCQSHNGCPDVIIRLTAWWGLATAEDASRMGRLLGRFSHASYFP